MLTRRYAIGRLIAGRVAAGMDDDQKDQEGAEKISLDDFHFVAIDVDYSDQVLEVGDGWLVAGTSGCGCGCGGGGGGSSGGCGSGSAPTDPGDGDCGGGSEGGGSGGGSASGASAGGSAGCCK